MKGWIIFLLAFMLYSVSVFGEFVQDDLKVIAGDIDMGKVSALGSAWIRPYYWMENEKSVYRPMTSFSFYVNSLITGREAWGFRLGNVLIYAWVCWLVYEVLRKVLVIQMDPRLREDDRLKKHCEMWALLGAVLFTVLPIHTEVVNNIVGRAEILALIFVILAILANFRNRWDLSATYLFLGLMSKETAVVGLPILLYLIISRSRNEMVDEVRNDGSGAWEKVAAIIFVLMAVVGFVFIRSMVLGGVGTTNNATIVENPLKFVTTEKRIMNAVSLVPLGVAKIIFPINLSYDYSFDQVKMTESWLDWRVLVGLGMVLISGVYLFGLRGLSLQVMGVVGMMFFWMPILITGNILFPIGTIFGERLWFLPSLGVVMVVLSFLRRQESINRYFLDGSLVKPGMTIMVLVLVLYAGRTVMRNFDWLSQERLFLHDAKYVSESVMAQNNAAAMYLIKHDLVNAKPIMEKANSIYPKYPELLNNWGLYYLWTGKFDEAKQKFEECLKERPGNSLCQGNLELIK